MVKKRLRNHCQKFKIKKNFQFQEQQCVLIELSIRHTYYSPNYFKDKNVKIVCTSLTDDLALSTFKRTPSTLGKKYLKTFFVLHNLFAPPFTRL